MHILEVKSGKYKGKRLKLTDKEVLIGRDEDCGIRIGSSEVSRHHCALVPRDAGVLVRDIESRNGTFIDGVPIHGEQLLMPGATLTVGPMTFQLVSATAPAVPQSVDDSLSDDDIATCLTHSDEETSD